MALRADVATSDLGLAEVTPPPRVVEALGDVVGRWAAAPETGRFRVDRDFGPEGTVLLRCCHGNNLWSCRGESLDFKNIKGH